MLISLKLHQERAPAVSCELNTQQSGAVCRTYALLPVLVTVLLVRNPLSFLPSVPCCVVVSSILYFVALSFNTFYYNFLLLSTGKAQISRHHRLYKSLKLSLENKDGTNLNIKQTTSSLLTIRALTSSMHSILLAVNAEDLRRGPSRILLSLLFSF